MVATASVETQRSAAVKPAVSFLDPRLPDAFWAQCSPCAVSGCWLWLGKCDRRGTPFFWFDSRRYSSRRLAYTALVGSVLSGNVISTCQTDGCCNPAHARLKMSAAERAEHDKQYMRSWYRRKPLRYKAYGVSKKYGITLDHVAEMRQRQGGGCAICSVRLSDEHNKADTLHIDHDHDSGSIRGLLCSCCNTGLGHFSDRPDLLSRAISYLCRHNVEAEGE